MFYILGGHIYGYICAIIIICYPESNIEYEVQDVLTEKKSATRQARERENQRTLPALILAALINFADS